MGGFGYRKKAQQFYSCKVKGRREQLKIEGRKKKKGGNPGRGGGESQGGLRQGFRE